MSSTAAAGLNCGDPYGIHIPRPSILPMSTLMRGHAVCRRKMSKGSSIPGPGARSVGLRAKVGSRDRHRSELTRHHRRPAVSSCMCSAYSRRAGGGTSLPIVGTRPKRPHEEIVRADRSFAIHRQATDPPGSWRDGAGGDERRGRRHGSVPWHGRSLAPNRRHG